MIKFRSIVKKINPRVATAVFALVFLGLLSVVLYFSYSWLDTVTPEAKIKKYMEKEVLSASEKDRVFDIMTKNSQSVELDQEERARLIELLNN